MPSASARASRASATSRGGVFHARPCAFFQQKCRQPAPGSSGGPPLWPTPKAAIPVLSSLGAILGEAPGYPSIQAKGVPTPLYRRQQRRGDATFLPEQHIKGPAGGAGVHRLD